MNLISARLSRSTRGLLLAGVAILAASALLGATGNSGAHPARPAITAETEVEKPWRVGLQVGHWRSYELPDELARLRTSQGTSGGGRWEWQLNLDIARRVAAKLEAEGVEVDILPATVPPGYTADAFISLHADGVSNTRLTGYKLARARMSAIPEIDDALLRAISEEYGRTTRLPVDPHVTRNMTGYYAFNSRRYRHAIAPGTPAVILEMGFMTNRSDLAFMTNQPDTVAEGISRGILRFLNAHGPATPAPSVTPTPAPLPVLTPIPLNPVPVLTPIAQTN